MSSEQKQIKTTAAMLHDNTASPRDERRTRGNILRGAVPYESHGKWIPADTRVDPVQILQMGDEGRIPELIPIRYGRMLKSPFTFFRGAAAIMAADLATTPDIKVRVQACGDCHALNFGAFATPERNVVFDLNDFDETLPAPWEWDLKRLTASLALISRNNGFKDKVAKAAVQSAVRAYREKMEEFSRMSILDIWYASVPWEHVIEEAQDNLIKKKLKARLKKAKKKTIVGHYFPKLVQENNGTYCIKDNPPLMFHLNDDQAFENEMKQGLTLYRDSLQDDKRRLLERYQLCDIAIKVVGIGSVGTTCAVALYLAPDNEPLFLQLKEARPSVLEEYCGQTQFDTNGERVVAGQRIMQSASDIFLGWMKLASGQHFYVRQLRDTKIKLVPEDWSESHLSVMAAVVGGVLARAHARSGDSAVISGYLGDSEQFDEAIADFAIAYADQTERDHALLEQAVKSGKIAAEVEEDEHD
jgi:uncharacterized protein (DUF2252 family)